MIELNDRVSGGLQENKEGREEMKVLEERWAFFSEMGKRFWAGWRSGFTELVYAPTNLNLVRVGVSLRGIFD